MSEFKPPKDVNVIANAYFGDIRGHEDGSELEMYIRQFDIAKKRAVMKRYTIISEKIIEPRLKGKSFVYEQGDNHTVRMTFYEGGVFNTDYKSVETIVTTIKPVRKPNVGFADKLGFVMQNWYQNVKTQLRKKK